MTALLTRAQTHARMTEPVTAPGRGRLREACHRIHLAFQEMDCASRRLVDPQARWSVDSRRNGR